ncbi:MAG TPA: hypothetical protein P5026_07365 [Kiritimatiellia bacterium]|nr:hypothetical protein [Kiritimatiellia bacterium]HRU70925.1 hypothetical protein [Kiritimatiellia bacterium]
MKSFLLLPFAVLLGILIGGWSPKEELRAIRQELDDLRKEASKREKSAHFDAITRMVQIPDRAAKASPPKPKATAPATDAPQSPTSHVAQAESDASAAPPEAAAPQTAQDETARAAPPEDLRARIEEAKELWATRVQIARSQWINRLKLTEEGATLFDAAIDAMNLELQASMQGLADALAVGEEMTPELGARFFNEMTTSLVRTYDDLTVIVPAEQRGEASKMELTDFIDPAVAEPLIAVQDKLEQMPRSRGPRFPRRPR